MSLDQDAIEQFEKERIVTALYYIVLGRHPDPGGLRSCKRGAGDEAWMRNVTSSLLSSEEFLSAAGSEKPSIRLCRNALGHDPGPDDDRLPLVDLVVNLVRRRHEEYQLASSYPHGVPVDDDTAYNRWLDEIRLRDRPASFSGRQSSELTVSVLILRRSADGIALDASLDSIAAQQDPSIEVVIASSGMPASSWPALAHRPGLRMKQVHSLFGSVSAALNKAARSASGIFIVLLEQGDLIDVDAVAHIAPMIESADILLSDEDVVDGDGRYRRPLMAGGWDADAALSKAPTGLVAVRGSVLRRIGGFRSAVDSEHVWDALLRASTAVGAVRIRRLSRVLLHRASEQRRSRPADDAREIVGFHLKATGRQACRIEGGGAEPIRVVYPLPRTPPMVSVIVCTRDRSTLLNICIEGLLHRTQYSAMEIIVVDNDSVEMDTKILLEDISRDERVRVIRFPGSFNWSAMNNIAVAQMRGEIAVLLNNDTDVIDANWLDELVSHAIRPDVGIVGAKLLYPDRTIQHAAIAMGPDCQSVHVWRHADGVAPGYLGQLKTVRCVSAVTGACLAIRRSVFMDVGGLEAEHLAVTWSDTDLCMRVRSAGLKIIWTPHCALYHIELASRGSDDTAGASERFMREHAYFRSVWSGFADKEHYFSSNLVLNSSTPLLKSCPEFR